MKSIVTAVLVAASCCVGCHQGDADLRDPAIRQQLTGMLGDLYTDRAVPKAISDLNAVLTVNSRKLSTQQAEKLRQARDKMVEMRNIIEEINNSDIKTSRTAEYRTLFSESKDLIGEAAATF